MLRIFCSFNHKYPSLGRSSNQRDNAVSLDASQLESDHLSHKLSLCQPLQELGKTVDLIIVFSVWKEGDFTLEIGDQRLSCCP